MTTQSSWGAHLLCRLSLSRWLHLINLILIVSSFSLSLFSFSLQNLHPSDNIDTYLTNFCVWQHKKRLRESGGPTPDWDHALLLSGWVDHSFDLCVYVCIFPLVSYKWSSSSRTMIVCVLVFCIDIIFVQQFLCIFLYFFLQPVCLPVCLSPSLARRVKCDDQFGRCHKVWMLNCSIQSNDLKKFGKRKRDAQMTIGERKEKKRCLKMNFGRRMSETGEGEGGEGNAEKRGWPGQALRDVSSKCSSPPPPKTLLPFKPFLLCSKGDNYDRSLWCWIVLVVVVFHHLFFNGHTHLLPSLLNYI